MDLKKKILFLSHGSTLNGAERVFLDAVRTFAEIGYEVEIILPPGGELLERCNQFTKNISTMDLPWWIDRGIKINFLKKLMVLLEIIKSTLKMFYKIKKSNCDIVISNTIAIPSGAIASFFLGKKHIWYVHEFGKEDHNFNFIFNEWFSCKLMSFLSDKIICNSYAVKGKFERYIQKQKIVVFYSAVNIDLHLPKVYNSLVFNGDNPLKIAMFGRVLKSKGQFEAIKAIEYLLKERKYEITFKIIGGSNDEYTLSLKKYIIDEKLENYIEIVDFVSNPIDLMRNFDICLNCSVQEAFGLITIESMKLGVPIIASNKGGNMELIDDDKNGFLYAQGNYRSLGEKIEYFYLNPNEIERIGNFAYGWSNNKFNSVNYKKDLHKVILEL